jgi:hypothetical protein
MMLMAVHSTDTPRSTDTPGGGQVLARTEARNEELQRALSGGEAQLLAAEGRVAAAERGAQMAREEVVQLSRDTALTTRAFAEGQVLPPTEAGNSLPVSLSLSLSLSLCVCVCVCVCVSLSLTLCAP